MDHLNRRKMLRLMGGGAMIAGAVAMPGILRAQTRELRIGTPYPNGGNMHQGLLKFAETIALESGGRYKVNVFTDSQIGDIQPLLTGMQLGTVDMALLGMSNATILKGGGSLSVAAVPYLFKSKTGTEKVVNGPLFADIFENVAKESGVRVYALGGARSPRALQTVRGPINVPDDLKDMRLRVPPVELYRAMFAKLGAKAVPTGLSDVYLALSKGQVEGQDNGFDVSLIFKWHEVAKFWSAIDHSFETNGWYMNNRLWESLSADDKALFRKAAAAGGADITRLGGEVDRNGVEALKQNGVAYTKPDLAPWRAALADVHQPFEGKLWPAGFVEKIRALPENV